MEPNRIRRHAGGLPALNDPNANLQWALTTINAISAWNIIPDRFLTSATSGSGRIRVAILDTGTDCTHSDFKNSGGSSVDSTQGGQLNIALSQAFTATTIASPACAWQDDYGHGTHVAGIIAAATQNAVGVSSLGYPIEVVTYKVLDSSGSGSDFTISQAIRAAADAGIHFVSMSLGGAGYSQNFQDAINYAWERNTLLMAAAGNSNSNSLFYPAGGNYVIRVAATDSNNSKASFSNWGPYNVNIAAPGVSIYSTTPGYPNPIGSQNYGYLSGTSMATPHVSALAGLIALTTPGFSVAAVAQRIQQSANSSIAGGGWDQYLGYGVIDASRAVTGNLRSATVGAIVGQIVDQPPCTLPATCSSLPVAGAVVSAGGQSFTTLSDGLFRLGNLAAGSYNLQVSASGYLTRNLTYVVRPGADTTATVAMTVNTGNFTGTVTSGGVSLGGAVVQALSSGLIKGTAISDSNGLYVLPMPPGTYDIQVAGISRITSTVTSKAVNSGGTTTVNLVLSSLGKIAGTVRNNNSVPLSGAQVTFSQSGTVVGGAVTDGSGNYSSIGLPSATYTVTASYTGFSDSAVNGVTVSPDNSTSVSIQMGSGGQTGATATFVKLDSTTQGNWKGVYGANGYNITGDTLSYPAYVTVTPNNNFLAVWNGSTSDVRALRKAASATDRIAGTWYNNPAFTIDLNFSDQATHQVAIYCLDWDTTARIQTVSVLDASTNATLDTRNVSGFNGGQYLVWNLSGHVILNLTRTAGSNAVMSGLFFDAPGAAPAPAVTVSPGTVTLTASQTQPFSATVTNLANQTVTWSLVPNVGTITSTGASSAQYQAPASIGVQQTVQVVATASNGTTTGSATVTLIAATGSTATFVKLDTTTQGNWKGVYGSAGYNITGDTLSYPAYVTVTPSANNLAVWNGSTSDVRALRKAASATDRIAGTWYNNPAFTVDLNFSDQATHQVAIYCLDWDTTARIQTVSVLDASTNATLDTRNVSGFNGGQYLVWNLSGHVILKLTWTAGANAVLSGLFFQ